MTSSKSLKFRCLLLSLLLIMSSISAADEYVENIKKRAEQGNAWAQSLLGDMYAEGRELPEDDAEAVRWYRMAAEQGEAGAQFALAAIYARGDGVTEDDAEAMRWYRMAAEQGYAQAQLNLGVM